MWNWRYISTYSLTSVLYVDDCSTSHPVRLRFPFIISRRGHRSCLACFEGERNVLFLSGVEPLLCGRRACTDRPVRHPFDVEYYFNAVPAERNAYGCSDLYDFFLNALCPNNGCFTKPHNVTPHLLRCAASIALRTSSYNFWFLSRCIYQTVIVHW